MTIPSWMTQVAIKAAKHGITFSSVTTKKDIHGRGWIDHPRIEKDQDTGEDVFVSEPYGIDTESLLDLAKFVKVSGCKCSISSSMKYPVSIRLWEPKHQHPVGVEASSPTFRYTHLMGPVDHLYVVYGLRDLSSEKFFRVGTHRKWNFSEEKIRKGFRVHNRKDFSIDILQEVPGDQDMVAKSDWIIRLLREGHPLENKQYQKGRDPALLAELIQSVCVIERLVSGMVGRANNTTFLKQLDKLYTTAAVLRSRFENQLFDLTRDWDTVSDLIRLRDDE